MTFVQYLSLLRRRWIYLAVGVVAGLAAGYVTAPGRAEVLPFEATHVLLLESNDGRAAALVLNQTALRATDGPVPIRVRQRLLEDDGIEAEAITATAAPDLGALRIRATAESAAAAERAADVTAEELLAALAGDQQEAFEQQLASSTANVAQLEQRLADLDAQLAGLDVEDPGRPPVQQRRNAADSQVVEARTQLATLQAAGPAPVALRTLERAVGAEVAADGIGLPTSKPLRALVLGSLGLLVGAFGAITAHRIDVRIRTKSDAEEAFGLPVLAEIPPKPEGRKGEQEVLSTPQPSTPVVEAYRALRTVVLYAAATADTPESESNGHNPARRLGAAQHADHDSQVVLVTSPTAGEGKTTTAALLATLLAEVGKSVLVVSADFRRPRIHMLFGVPREPGLADVLTGDATIALADLHLDTTVPGLRLLPSGSPVNNPAPFLRETAQLIAAARRLFDYVIVDTAPLLVANDATELAGVADVVLVLCRADRTTREAARHAAEVLQRVDAPVLGTVLIAAAEAPTAYRYYKYRYYADADADGGDKGTRRSRSSKRADGDRDPAGAAASEPR